MEPRSNNPHYQGESYDYYNKKNYGGNKKYYGQKYNYHQSSNPKNKSGIMLELNILNILIRNIKNFRNEL